MAAGLKAPRNTVREERIISFREGRVMALGKAEPESPRSPPGASAEAQSRRRVRAITALGAIGGCMAPHPIAAGARRGGSRRGCPSAGPQ
jgi:hypothetical protein